MEIEWPTLGDRFFHAAAEGPSASLDVFDLVAYASGYRAAALILLDHLAARRDADTDKFGFPGAIAYSGGRFRVQDSLVHPALFLARHSIELMLKALYRLGARLFDEALPTWFENCHSLTRLWGGVKDFFSRIEPPGESIEVVEKCIGELEGVDPGSFTFRYTDRKAQLTLARAPSEISLDDFARTLIRVHRLLNAGYDQLSDILDAQP